MYLKLTGNALIAAGTKCCEHARRGPAGRREGQVRLGSIPPWKKQLLWQVTPVSAGWTDGLPGPGRPSLLAKQPRPRLRAGMSVVPHGLRGGLNTSASTQQRSKTEPFHHRVGTVARRL